MKPSQDKQTKKRLVTLDENTQTYHVYKYMIAGYSMSQIAEIMEVDVTHIKALLKRAVVALDEEVQSIKENWFKITLARTEIFMKKLLEQVSNKELGRDDVAMFKDLYQIQEALFEQGKQKAPILQQFNFVRTIDSGSELHREATARQQAAMGYDVMPELLEYVPQGEDELEGILSDDS